MIIQPKVIHISLCLLSGKSLIPSVLMLLQVCLILFKRTSKYLLRIDDLAVLFVCLFVCLSVLCHHAF